jgi:flagellar hook-associated protein 1
MGLTSALNIAGRSLEIFSAGIQVAGNNISNSNSPDYIREQLELRSSFPVQEGSLILGSGAYAVGVRQQIDKYLEKRIYVASADFYGADARNGIYKQLESALQELGDTDLSTQLNDLMAKFNDLVNQPELTSNRELVVRQARQFAQFTTDLRTRIDRLRTDFGVRIDDLVTEANRLIDQISDLNPKITALEASGLLKSDAGGMRAQRYAALTRLAEIVPIRTIEHDTGGIDVFLGNDDLVIPGKVQHLEALPRVDRGVVVTDVRVEKSTVALAGTQGLINGTVFGRDALAGSFLDKFDDLVSNLIHEVNLVHASGQGTHGFTSVAGTYAVSDPTVSLAAAGLPFTPVNGSFEVRIRNSATGVAKTSVINVDLDGIGADTTFNNLLTQLNGVANLTATTTPDQRLQLTAAGGYEIEFAADSSGALASLGINTLFTGSSSRDIGVNSMIVADAGLLAAARGGGPGDGRNAARLASIAFDPITALGDKSLTEFYQTTLSGLAQGSASEEAVTQGFRVFRESLLNQRAQHSGVSLDEETIEIMKYQYAYQMSARIISTVDQLFTTLLQV